MLVGMMGCGKSRVGRELARLTKRRVWDTDTMVERDAGMPVKEIFQRHGEEEFRRLEAAAVVEAVKKPAGIIATGGGAVLRGDNRRRLWKSGMVVYLQGSVETLYERVRRNRKRPLLQKENPRAVLEEILRKRDRLYRKAHVVVCIDGGEARRTAEVIWEAYEGMD